MSENDRTWYVAAVVFIGLLMVVLVTMLSGIVILAYGLWNLSVGAVLAGVFVLVVCFEITKYSITFMHQFEKLPRPEE